MSTILILDFVIIVMGTFLVYVTWDMKKTGKVSSILLAEVEMKRLKDKKGFIDFIYPTCLIFGIVTIVLGIIGVISDQVSSIPYWNYIQMVIFVIVFLVFTRRFRQAREKFIK